MSGWDVAGVAGGAAAAVVVTVVVTVVLARLVVAVASLDRTTRDLVHAIEDVRRDVAGQPAAHGNRAVGAPDSVEVGGPRRSNGSGGIVPGGRGSGGVHVRVRLSDLGLVSPVIKARALGRGTSQAARQFRQRREG